ncbi:MAG: tRNA (adenine-N1)-methyltransferase [Candidatus Thermoplasmatota archaeon]|nr:tRNA (adenine-N1)-methyltransferase [Candidatus Thermoplasmatota archaeon]MBS3790240.1 tRNA (adenine-N1)-methyltransferase [Candidatus Thermoplasmatota archaeon]
MIEKGNIVMFWSKNEKYLCRADGDTKKVTGIGVVNTDRLIGTEWGTELDLGKGSYHLLQPTIKDIPDLFDRGAQIVLPRIGGLISTYCDLSSGKKVIEGGAGSGALTAVLSQMVRPDGEVITYELKDESIKRARKNLKKLELDKISTIKKGDVTSDVDEKDVDALILDIPEPWKALDTAKRSLSKGGFFAAYIPTMNQLEKITLELKGQDYIDIKTFENLERDIVAKQGAVRPSYDVLGHTGYVIIGRKI